MDGWKEERTVISGWQKDHRHEQEDEWEKKTSLIYNVKGRGIHSATERERAVEQEEHWGNNEVHDLTPGSRKYMQISLVGK